MNLAVTLLALAALAWIGALPRIYFKSNDRLGAAWWLTALPFIVCGASLVGSVLGIVPSFWEASTVVGQAAAVAAALSIGASLALLGYTLGTHRIPIALWHQANDAPAHIVTWGAYARLRHPFYASFLLTLAGALLLAPSWGTLAAFLYAVAALSATAAREERRLSASEFGAEYRAYMARTGRLFPRLQTMGGAP